MEYDKDKMEMVLALLNLTMLAILPQSRTRF